MAHRKTGTPVKCDLAEKIIASRGKATLGFTNNQNILLLQAQARKAGWKRTINRILKKGNIDVSHAGAKGRITKKAIDETVRHLKGNIYRARELGEETKARQFERILGRIKKHLPQKK